MCCFITAILILACNKKYEQADAIKEELHHNIQQGNWKITKYIRYAEDKSLEWSDVTLNFKKDDVLDIITDSATYSGWWRLIIFDEQYEGAAYDYINFNIGMNVHQSLDSLNDDWSIVSYSSVKVELMEAYPDTNLIDLLTLEKIN